MLECVAVRVAMCRTLLLRIKPPDLTMYFSNDFDSNGLRYWADAKLELRN